jgi:hypothetical protein
MKTRRLVAAAVAAAAMTMGIVAGAAPASATTCEWHEKHGGKLPYYCREKPAKPGKPGKPGKPTPTTIIEETTTTIVEETTTTKAPATTVTPKDEPKTPKPVKVSPRFTG